MRGENAVAKRCNYCCNAASKAALQFHCRQIREGRSRTIVWAIALHGLAMRWHVQPCREWRGARVARVGHEGN